MSILGKGVYSFREAARLTGLRLSRVSEWFRERGVRTRRKPIFSSDYEPIDGDYAISFLDLIDVYVGGQLRDHGVSLQTLRRVYDKMKQDLRTSHPFCRRELLSDGKTVFQRGLDQQGEEELMEVLTRQKVFPQILLPFLKKIAYDELTRLAKKWRIDNMVVIDPAICFGKPIVEPVGITTAVLATAYHANGGDAELVADWYDVHSSHILAAVQFEKTIAA
jgi:uncharacterized protein (DUF433 family)